MSRVAPLGPAPRQNGLYDRTPGGSWLEGGQAAVLLVQRAWDRWTARGSAGVRRAGGLGYVWTIVCWLLTLHFAIATILVFADFEHLGSRIAAELWRRW